MLGPLDLLQPSTLAKIRNMKKEFNYYNITSRLLLLALGFLPMLCMGIWMIVYGNTMAHILSVLLFFLAGVFLYKVFFIKIQIDQDGLSYRSPLNKKTIAWTAVHDVLIVVRERRNIPDYYPFLQWHKAGNKGKSYFLLFRTDAQFPQNPMFMFSSPVTPQYLSVQYRNDLAKEILKYYR